LGGAGRVDRAPTGSCAFEGFERRICIARLPAPATPTRDGPRVNQEIMVPRVRLVDERGEMVGVVTRNEALQRATDAGLDLVEVAANADPPVVKILDFGKYKYEEQKRKNEARKKQKVIEIKEIKLRPGIDDHDYEVKMRSMVKFIEEGDKVKVTMRFRGRELAHQELGMNVLMRVRDDLDKTAKIEQHPRMEGRQMTMVLSPK
jgi:translation initiation factor IF-3